MGQAQRDSFCGGEWNISPRTWDPCVLVMAMACLRAAVQSPLPTVSASMVLLESSYDRAFLPSVMLARLGLMGGTHTVVHMAIRGLEHPHPMVHRRPLEMLCNTAQF